MILSVSYAIIVVMTGFTIYSFDVIMKEAHAIQITPSSTFNLFLCTVGIAWLCYLVFDIKRYIEQIETLSRHSKDLGKMELEIGDEGELHIDMSLPGEKKTVPEYYGFTSGRHSGSFFLKIGAGVFCIGHAVQMGLNLVQEIKFATSQNQRVRELCSCYLNLCVDILTPTYSIIQCFVIFKYGNVIVNKNKWIARFAFMHCISASFCLWMHTIINKILDALVAKHFYNPDCNVSEEYFFGISSQKENISEGLHLSCLDKEISNSEHFDCVLELRYFCAASEQLSHDLFDFASLLYPFSIEFSILVVGVWYILWSNIGKINTFKDSLHFLPSVTPHGSLNEGQAAEGHKKAMILTADCSSPNKGLFIGIILLIITIIGGAVVLIAEDPCGKSTVSLAVVVSNVVESSLLVICIIASIM